MSQVVREPGWQAGKGQASLGFSGTDNWLRYSFAPSQRITIFAVNNPWLLRFEMYALHDGEVIQEYSAGTARPFKQRPLATTGFAFPIPAGADQVYIRDTGYTAAIYPVVLTTPAEYSAFSTRLMTFLGMYYGIVLILLLYNVALFFGTRDKTYIAFSLYTLSLIAFLTVADGSGSMFLWPNDPAVNQLMLPVGWAGLVCFLLELSHRFLNVRHHSRRLSLAHRALQCTGLLLGLNIAVAPSALGYMLQTAISGVALAFLLGNSLYFTARRFPNANLFLLANSMFVIGGFTHILMLFGILTPTSILHHSIHIGSMLELALFSIALSRRLRESERARWAAFRHSQDLRRRNQELSAAKSLAEEHRQLQKSLQQAQKLRTLGQLAGGFAHDFNNILASILGFTELARDPDSLADKGRVLRYLQEIEKSGQRGAELVRQLLVYSRNAPPAPQQLNLAETLSNAAALLRGSLPATVEIFTHPPRQPLHMHMDPEQIQQVLVNLSVNAAEAMHNRGRIDITLGTTRLDDLHCTSCMNRFSGDYVVLKVEDTGEGIAGNAGQLFTPFQTTKEIGQGTGLGLSVVHGIVHEHGGHIHASNRVEGGARFSIYLPVKAAPVGVRDAKRILLVEDDPSVAAYLATLLAENDFNTTHAQMPTEALATFVTDPHGFDLVITDHLMPQGTGLEIAEDIHALRPELPVILTTGNVNNLDANEVTSAGIASVFEKPLNSDQLVAKIHGLLAN
ncbi:MAG: 7TM diverse intracellular signaling domain-containing protein [Pseudomonadota bacterium]